MITFSGVTTVNKNSLIIPVEDYLGDFLKGMCELKLQRKLWKPSRGYHVSISINEMNFSKKFCPKEKFTINIVDKIYKGKESVFLYVLCKDILDYREFLGLNRYPKKYLHLCVGYKYRVGQYARRRISRISKRVNNR